MRSNNWPTRKLFKSVAVLVLILSLLTPSRANAYQLISKNSSEEIISHGMVLQTVRMNTDEGPLNVYVLTIDLTSPYVTLDTIVGADGTLNKNQSVLDMARRTSAVAAINGDFFQMKESGHPIGILYQDGRLLGSPAMRDDMFGFGITRDKLPILGIFGFSGEVTAGNGKSFALSGINKPGYLLQTNTSCDVDALLLYDSMWGTTSRGALSLQSGTVEAVVRNGIVQQVLTDHPGVPIPSDGYVLKGHGQAAEFLTENLPQGSKVSFTYSVTPNGDELYAAVGGQALLVEDGHLPAYFSQNITGKHARTAVGASREGKTLYLVAVEKQIDAGGSVLSRGMTQEELAEFLISLGVWRAVNLDGGGSTTLAARHLGDFNVSLMNRPQGGTQRSVPDAIGIFSTAPQGPLKGLVVSGPPVLFTGTNGEFTVKGYDEYYNPVRTGPGKVQWSVTPAAGDWRDNLFFPNKSGDVTVRATMDGIQGSAGLRVIGPESLSALLVTPSSMIIEPGKSVQLSVKVSTKYGEIFDLKPEDVQWSVDKDLGQIAGGKFTAVDRKTSGSIAVSFNGLNVQIPVTVEPPGIELQVEPERDASKAMDQWVTVHFTAGTVLEPVTVKLGYAKNPSELPEGYVALSAITAAPADGRKLNLNTPWRVSWFYEKDTVAGRPAVLQWDPSIEKWREQPARVIEDGSHKEISARVWGWGKLMLVDDRRPEASFKDTGAHWARPSIQTLAARGVVNGFPDGTFQPDQAVTRAQFVSMLAAALQWPIPENTLEFEDQVPAWAVPAVAAALSRGIITGYPDGTFLPEKRITRSEMAVILSRAMSIGEPEAGKPAPQYKDSKTIPDFARNAVDNVSAAGLLQGSGGQFRPLDGATRAETAVAVNRLLNWWVSR